MKRNVFILLSIGILFTVSLVSARDFESTKGQIRVEPALFIGFGLKSHKVGVTTTGDDITISGGGGFGYGLTIGYGLQDRIDIEGTIGLQNSSLNPKVSNASGEFSRKFLLITGKRKFPFGWQSLSAYKIGVGLGYYLPGSMELDFTQLGYNKESVDYKNGTGFHITFDYEALFNQKTSWSLGLRYAHVSYKADSITIGSYIFPAEFISDDYNPLNGGTIDMIFALKF